MQVVGPNKREMSSVLAQLRHLYANMMRHGDGGVRSMADGILSRQIRRLESLDRVLFDQSPEAREALDQGSASSVNDGEDQNTPRLAPDLQTVIEEAERLKKRAEALRRGLGLWDLDDEDAAMRLIDDLLRKLADALQGRQ